MAVEYGIAFGHTVYEFLSSYVPLKKIISDLVASWREMFIMIVVALISAFASAFVIHCIAGIASWIIMSFVAVALIGNN